MRPFALVFILAGCNHAPTFSVAAQTVKQGQSVAVTLMPADSDGDSVAITVAAVPDGLVVETDGRQLTLYAGYSISGAQEVMLQLDDHKGGLTQVPVAVMVTPIGWQWSVSFTDPAPTAREHGVFVVDGDRDLAYLLGGSGYMPQGDAALDAYWSFDLSARTWSVLTPAGDVPPPQASMRLADIPSQKRAYLFGGYSSNSTASNELYRFDYSQSPPAFTLLTQDNPPSARELHSFGYDAASDTFVMFGGIAATGGALGDTWTMKLTGDHAVWTKQMVTGPVPRYGFFFAMSGSKLYIWSGATKTASIAPAADTWAFDVATLSWAQLLDGSEDGAPQGRRNGSFVLDHDRLVIFGGTADGATTVPGLTFLDLNRLSWSTVTLDQQPHLRSSSFGFYDPKREQSVLGFGNDRGLYRDLSAVGY